MAVEIGQGVWRCDHAELRLVDQPWRFATENVDLIEAHWQAAIARQPKLFNGRVMVMVEGSLAGGRLTGRLIEVDFKAFLAWRSHVHLEPATRDCFGSGIVISADGAVLLGRQSKGNMNEGLAYPPGGMIDARDIASDGRISIAASIARELAEETGLGPAEAPAEPGVLVVAHGHKIALGVVHRSPLTAAALRERIRAHIAADHDPELADVVFVATRAEADRIATPDFVRPLLAHLLPA